MTKANYEARRALENENATLRQAAENKRLKREELADETVDLFMTSLKDFLNGKAVLKVEAGGSMGWTVRFLKS